MISFTSIVKTLGGWLFTWADSGASFYRIVLWGSEVARTTGTSYQSFGGASAKFPPPLEVVGEDDRAETELYEPHLYAQWYGEQEASYYSVERKDQSSGLWSEVRRIAEAGLPYYSWFGPVTPDGARVDVRVSAVDSVGNRSPARAYGGVIVCPPQPTDGKVSVGYSGGNVVVSAV